MNERQQALASSAYQQLREIYFNRDKAALERKAKGGRIALVMGSDVPEEILYAAGYLPVQVHSNYGEETSTDLYLEETCDHDAWTRGVVQKLTDGRYAAFAERVVISYSSLRMYNLFNVLREVRRLMPEVPVPYVEFLDTDYDNTLLAQKHNLKVFRKFRQDVETWTGQEIPEEKLLEAIQVYNDDRQAMREFDMLRRAEEPRVTGTEAMVVLGASLFMDKAEHAALVRQLTEEAASWPVVDGVRVHLIGSDQDLTELYDLIADKGGHVVSEDHNFGARVYEKDVTYLEDPVRGLVDRYIYRTPTGKVSIRQRVEAVGGNVDESGAKAVVMALKVNDIGASWEYPSIKAMLDGKGIPIVRFYDQETPMADPEAVAAAVDEMLNIVKGGN